MIHGTSAVAPGDPAFQRTWERTDGPVASGQISRTWMWGPEPFTSAITEPYADSPGDQRLVQYFDKSRMEITDPDGDAGSSWYVTNGLLVVELMSGRMQVGATSFVDRAPAVVNVAGDPGDPLTYAVLAQLRDDPPLIDGATVTQRVDSQGHVTPDHALATYAITAAYHVQVPGIDHQIASVFWTFMNSSGLVWEDGQSVTAPLFLDPFYATGYPLIDPYWASVSVDGVPRDVLLQCFERRCLTYTPGNPDGWQVEAGNVGRHYYQWRYAAPALTDPWTMFHHDERHTGVSDATGNIDPSTGPRTRWTYRVTDPPTEEEFLTYRWYSSFPIGDLNGDGTLEVVVTSPDNTDEPPRVIALVDDPSAAERVRALWTYTSPGDDAAGYDQYSAALVDADGDGLLDVVFTSKGGWVRALKGTTGAVIWSYQTGHFIEAGPMLADLEGDGTLEVIVTSDCVGFPACHDADRRGGLFVFEADPSGSGLDNPPLWQLDLPWKADSEEPAVADLDPGDGTNRKAIVFGTWGGTLNVAWRQPNGMIVHRMLELRSLDPSVPHGATPAMRSSPMIADFGEGLTAVFGWMPDPAIGIEARLSAVGLVVNMELGAVEFTPRWTVNRDTWKSSAALLSSGSGPPLVVAGYGIGTASGTGNYGQCAPLNGGVVAVDSTGNIVWENEFDDEGNVRGSPAVADTDGDGELEVILAVGCYGAIYAFDGVTGDAEWRFQLGPRTIASPSIGDLDGDGNLEIIVASYDGNVYALGGGN